jgi:Mn-dependent DtxR family transcriptional regulator
MLSQTEKHALRALFRCARYRRAADVAALSLRVPGSPSELAAALRALEARGLVASSPSSLRLTMDGLAVAAALLPPIAAGRRRGRTPLRVVRAA